MPLVSDVNTSAEKENVHMMEMLNAFGMASIPARLIARLMLQ